MGIVIGGGNFWRGRTSETIDRSKADQIGMLATVMNCIYVSEIFRYAGMKTQVLTPLPAVPLRSFTQGSGKQHFDRGMVIFCRRHRPSLFFYRYSHGIAGSGDRGRWHSSGQSCGRRLRQ